MLKKALLIGTLLLSSNLYAIDSESDYYVGWTGVQQNFNPVQGENLFQKGVDLGARLLYLINDDETLGLGFEAGFSHIETNFAVGGNIVHAQFILKYKLLEFIEVFGGGGLAGRGMPSAGDYGVTAIGGVVNAGAAFVTIEDKYRLEATFSYYPFSTTKAGVPQAIDSYGVGIHAGITIDTRN